ncbi:hypothetical protein HN748_03365 [Candidatus Peregrinibacteria bacterium]|jgi:hypothetical protein|nr:hypothetical protein [Candidatus Peregrinibacteria bacterium]MBT7484238.1 hypothetical protein [Candidatus Peregrinibacteria bacterium]MBT7703247.1 hypothetical protein [Candidatus Peregrinibacteria bacterium]
MFKNNRLVSISTANRPSRQESFDQDQGSEVGMEASTEVSEEEAQRQVLESYASLLDLDQSGIEESELEEDRDKNRVKGTLGESSKYPGATVKMSMDGVNILVLELELDSNSEGSMQIHLKNFDIPQGMNFAEFVDLVGDYGNSDGFSPRNTLNGIHPIDVFNWQRGNEAKDRVLKASELVTNNSSLDVHTQVIGNLETPPPDVDSRDLRRDFEGSVTLYEVAVTGVDSVTVSYRTDAEAYRFKLVDKNKGDVQGEVIFPRNFDPGDVTLEELLAMAAQYFGREKEEKEPTEEVSAQQVIEWHESQNLPELPN